MRRLLLILAILLTLAFPAWATNYYVDSSATIAISGSTGTAVAGDWLMQATTNAKCRYMSGTGPITVSAITPGQPTSTSNQNPSTTGVWTDISPTYTFTITSPASPVGAQTVYINNSQQFYVNTAISSGTSLIATGTGAPAASGTLYKQYVFAITSASASAGATYTNNGATFTVTTAASSATTLMCYGTGAPALSGTSGTLTYVSGTPSGNITFSSDSSGTGPAAIAFSAETTSQGATFTPTGAPAPNGSDSNAGTSSGAPWATLTYATANAVYTGGNSLLMACGDTWIDRIFMKGGGTSLASPFTVGNYGTGANPQIYGGLPKSGSDWQQAYIFTVTALTTATNAGATYTDSSLNVFTVLINTAISGTTLTCSGPVAPAGTPLLKTGGTGQASITYSAVSANAFYCYLTGYDASRDIATGSSGNGISVVYDLDGDILAYDSTIATLATTPGWYYSTSMSALFINLTGLSPAAPGGTNPITSNNIYWPGVYAFGVLTNYTQGLWGANAPTGGMTGGIYPQISYINLGNFDLFYSNYGLFLGDLYPVYCSSYCNVSNMHVWFSWFSAIGAMGSYNNVYSCTAHHCKCPGWGCFGLWGQGGGGGQVPATANDNFYDSTFADNINVPTYCYVLGTTTGVGTTGGVANCGFYNTNVTGNCNIVASFDASSSGSSLITIQNMTVTGQANQLITNSANGLTVDGLYCPTAPRSTTGAAIQPTCTGTNPNIFRRLFIYSPNQSAIALAALPSGSSFGCYSSIFIGAAGASASYNAIYVTGTAGCAISVCNNVCTGFAYLFGENSDLTAIFTNNIAFASWRVLSLPSGTPANLTSDFNYAYNPVNGWYGSNTVTAWHTTSGQDYHSYSGSTLPGFANASTNLNVPTDFMLKWGAQAMYPNWVCSISGATGKPAPNYILTVSSANATVGATYTNGGQTFQVCATIASGTTLRVSGTGGYSAPPAGTWTLTKASGTGDSTITVTAYTTNTLSPDRDYFGTAMPNGGGMQDVGAFQVNRQGGAN
jgi:hypothetical protein